jgi:hypothetical protein
MKLRRITSTIVIEIRKEIPVDYVVDLDTVPDATASLYAQVDGYRMALGGPQAIGPGQITLTMTTPLALLEGAVSHVYSSGYMVEAV